MSTRTLRTTWEYRTLNLSGDSIQHDLNEAGAEGFHVVYANHAFRGPDDPSGICFVMMGREVDIEVETSRKPS